ncbi:hypothetical protein J5N97_020475 [Dioscorea zingiberensis]|uniref:Uncharacterized protein n=1 Tax=Dioscorea zingiberensis TaxID=325984 RepID=A0A9D5CFW4_9LILI|nr:hypothetical protein J5N97_020475 [Dioscorea zingiberensis]
MGRVWRRRVEPMKREEKSERGCRTETLHGGDQLREEARQQRQDEQRWREKPDLPVRGGDHRRAEEATERSRRSPSFVEILTGRAETYLEAQHRTIKRLSRRRNPGRRSSARRSEARLRPERNWKNFQNITATSVVATRHPESAHTVEWSRELEKRKEITFPEFIVRFEPWSMDIDPSEKINDEIRWITDEGLPTFGLKIDTVARILKPIGELVHLAVNRPRPIGHFCVMLRIRRGKTFPTTINVTILRRKYLVKMALEPGQTPLPWIPAPERNKKDNAQDEEADRRRKDQAEDDERRRKGKLPVGPESPGFRPGENRDDVPSDAGGVNVAIARDVPCADVVRVCDFFHWVHFDALGVGDGDGALFRWVYFKSIWIWKGVSLPFDVAQGDFWSCFSMSMIKAVEDSHHTSFHCQTL